MEIGAITKHNIQKASRTGDWRYMKPAVDKKKCAGCQTCVPYCPEAVISMEKYKDGQKDKADIDYEFCKGCGVCAAVCPNKAVKMEKN